MYLQKYQTPTRLAVVKLYEAGAVHPASDERVGCVVTAIDAPVRIALSADPKSPPSYVLDAGESVVVPPLYLGPVAVILGKATITELVAGA